MKTDTKQESTNKLQLPEAEMIALFDVEEDEKESPRKYRPVLTATENRKGVLDVDTVKGCTCGMAAYPGGGCYGECYARKTAAMYGIDFSTSVPRKLFGAQHTNNIRSAVADHKATWYRVGTFGDPCHDWENTLSVCEALRFTNKTPVIVTKHWITLTDEHIVRFKNLSAVFNTSTSGLDTDEEIAYRVSQMNRLRDAGIHSVCRVVTCAYGDSQWANERNEKQSYLLSLDPVIDNPLRLNSDNALLLSGEISATKHKESIGGGKLVSLHSDSAYLGSCDNCPDQCGVEIKEVVMTKQAQVDMFPIEKEFVYVESVIGSGYEEDVARLAIEDKIAYRAARKNMQIHSAIILKIDGAFSGFFTFENNDECKEFCMLQSVIRPELHDDELYKEMTLQALAHNTNGYPALMTTNPKSKFETPKLFESLGFETYFNTKEFHYMAKCESLDEVRLKLLAHITMTNVWNSIKGGWLKVKKDWKARIEEAGVENGIEDPAFATRRGCWQGSAGFSNVVLSKRTIEKDGKIKKDSSKSHNGNASVLDPVACEVILRFFTPTEGKRVYNPFGGGVQFGFVAGASGYEYVASEIRQNQCDANNALCSDFPGVEWIQSDSSTYKPEGLFDLVFTCPPYYRIEKYVDYDGESPEGEINSMGTYEEFRDTLFAGYKMAIDSLKDNRFFVVMTGDSRDKNGAYLCHESETELFLKDNGLSIYNKIVYLECEFTRLAQAKKTLNYRKFPKREQKIIVAYKGDMSKIKEEFAKVGRL